MVHPSQQGKPSSATSRSGGVRTLLPRDTASREAVSGRQAELRSREGDDRQLLEAYENPTTALLSLRVERSVESRITLLKGLSDALKPTLSALGYRLDKHTKSYQWMCVLAGTRQYATPHATSSYGLRATYYVRLLPQ
jgi:hypothetical protein